MGKIWSTYLLNDLLPLSAIYLQPIHLELKKLLNLGLFLILKKILYIRMYGNFLFNFAFKKLQECTLQKKLSAAEEG